MMQLKSRTLVDAMREEDIPEVQAIERQIFPTPWPRNAYYRELHHNRSAYYLVLRRDEEIVGYAGLWKMSDEAHITTVGVRANQQGKGYDEPASLMIRVVLGLGRTAITSSTEMRMPTRDFVKPNNLASPSRISWILTWLPHGRV